MAAVAFAFAVAAADCGRWDGPFAAAPWDPFLEVESTLSVLDDDDDDEFWPAARGV